MPMRRCYVVLADERAFDCLEGGVLEHLEQIISPLRSSGTAFPQRRLPENPDVGVRHPDWGYDQAAALQLRLPSRTSSVQGSRQSAGIAPHSRASRDRLEGYEGEPGSFARKPATESKYGDNQMPN